MKLLLILISLLTFTGTTYTQVYSKPTNSVVRPKVVKTVISKVVGARSFSATAYCLTGKMANGQKVHLGAIAADPRVLKLGTKVMIHGRGTYIVKDTGGAIKSNKIDIWFPSCSQARAFGRRTIQLTVLN